MNGLGEPAADQEGNDNGNHAHDQSGSHHGVLHGLAGRHDRAVRQGDGSVPGHGIADLDGSVVGGDGFVFQAPALYLLVQRAGGQRQNAGLVDQVSVPAEQGGAANTVAAAQVVELHFEKEGVVSEQGFAGGVGQLLGDGGAKAVGLVAHAAELIIEQQGTEDGHAAENQQRDRQPQFPGHREIRRHIGGQPLAEAGAWGAGLFRSLWRVHVSSLVLLWGWISVFLSASRFAQAGIRGLRSVLVSGSSCCQIRAYVMPTIAFSSCRVSSRLTVCCPALN